MRKISIGVIVLFFVVMLASCSSEPNNSAFRLDTPTNIETERNILMFEAVKGASSYILSINGENIKIDEPTYTFTKDGTYKVRIQAVSSVEDYVDSLFTHAIEIKVRFIPYPDDIGIINNQVSFTQDPDADSYDIQIDSITYNSKTDLPPYLEPGTYDIRIKSRSAIYNESDYSPITTVLVDQSDRLVTKHTYQYSINSSSDLPIYRYMRSGLNYMNIVQTLVEKELVQELESLTERADFYAAENTIYLSMSYMNYLVKQLKSEDASKDKVVTFMVHTNLGDHEIRLELKDLSTPYSYNGENQRFNFKDDVWLGFETFDYKFISLEGYNMMADDYDFTGNILTIYAKFIQDTYTMHKSENSLEFLVSFQKDGIVVKYPIYISK